MEYENEPDALLEDGEGEEARLVAEALDEVRKLRMLAVDIDGAHTNERQDALHYYNGDLDKVSDEKDQVPDYPGRSTVDALTLAETVETMLPVLMDVCTDKDSVKFKSRPGEPEEIARAEADAVHSLIYDEQDGWQVVHDCIHDAMLGRYGCAYVGNDMGPYGPRVTIEAVHPNDVQFVPTARGAAASPYWSILFRMSRGDFQERYPDLNPDDYMAAPERLADTERNYDGAVIQEAFNIGVLVHIIKRGPVYLVIETDYSVSTILSQPEELPCLPLIWFTVYRRPHGLVSWSVYDRVKGSQRVQTALQRLGMDAAQFSQINRPVLVQDLLTDQTVEQLANDAPGAPVVVRGAGAITPLYQSSGLPFDLMGMLEHSAADVESRAGVGRNMQGLNSEALHDTASVGMAMENRQQMRVRTIARHIVETAIKPLFEAVHHIARMIGVTGAVNGQEFDASQWPAVGGCTAMVDIKGGPQAQMAKAQAVRTVVTELTALQGGPNGPFVKGEQILEAARMYLRAAGIADTSPYVPEKFEQPLPPEPQDPMQSPEMRLKVAELEMRMEIERMKVESQMEIQRMKLEAELELARQKMAAEVALGGGNVDQSVRLGGDIG